MNAFFAELFQTGIYKRTQGRITRQVTAAVIAITMAMGLWQLSNTLLGKGAGLQFGLPAVLFLLGLWVTYRVVNLPNFADFLIAVEAEMNKVSWPSRTELFRASMVVLITIFSLATLLYGFDAFWHWFFGMLGMFPEKEAQEAAMADFGGDWSTLLGTVTRGLGV